MPRRSRHAISAGARPRSTVARTRSSGTSSRSTCSGSKTMDFSLTEEQQLLRDAIARFIANEYSFEERKSIVASPKGWSDKVWSKFAEMGLLGVPFQEVHGGFGGSGVDLMVVAQELGRGMVVEPYLATVVLAGGLVELAGTAAQQRDILPGIIKGRWLLALAYGEP